MIMNFFEILYNTEQYCYSNKQKREINIGEVISLDRLGLNDFPSLEEMSHHLNEVLYSISL